MARFLITITIDDDRIETIDDVSYMTDNAWGDGMTSPAITFEGKTPVKGSRKFAEKGYKARVDPTSISVKAVGA
jgi:hypothetical protein